MRKYSLFGKILLAIGGIGSFVSYHYFSQGERVVISEKTTTFEQILEHGMTNFLQRIDPEIAHWLAIQLIARGFSLRERDGTLNPQQEKVLETNVWGRSFRNPIGVAAGFDKNAQAIDGLLNLGFGFVEIGTVCPKAQKGNPRPRVFRLPEDHAIVNRYGFNSDGADIVAERLKNWRAHREESKSNILENPIALVGVNLGKNRESCNGNIKEFILTALKTTLALANTTTIDANEDLNDQSGEQKKDQEQGSILDYVQGVQKLSPYADYIVINISSPNTPNLRDLQREAPLRKLLKSVKQARESQFCQCQEKFPSKRVPPLLVKISPDLNAQERADIARVVLEVGIDGIIVSNTTTSRPSSLICKTKAQESGGLSGTPLFDLSNHVLSDMYRLTKGEIPLIGVGGIFNGHDAFEKIRAGASLVELYTGMIFEGPHIATKIKCELSNLLIENGFQSIQEAVGSATKMN